MQRIVVMVLILFSINTKGTCQGQGEKINEWIPKIIEYRSYLLRRNPNATIELKELINKWDSLNTTEEERIKMTFNILTANEIYGYKFKSVKKKALKHDPESKIAKALTEQDLLVIKRNSELLDMIHLGLLKSKYSFNIDGKTNLFKEIESCEFISTDRIAEIGCGAGAYGMLLNKIEPTIKLYLNELKPSFLEYLRLSLEKSERVFDFSNINLVKGSRKSTNLENLNLDKIIIRNTFHHFGKKEEMLESISKSLKEEGVLYVLESTIELNKDGDICDQAMDKDRVISIIEQSDFKFVSEVELGESVLLKFLKGSN